MSKNGLNVAVLCYNKLLILFKDGEKIAEHSDVINYDISDIFFGFSTSEQLRVYNLQITSQPAFVHGASIKIREIHCLNTCVLYVSDKKESLNEDERQYIYLFKDEKVHLLLESNNIYRTTLKSTKDETRLLILADLEYSKNSYYAISTLYLLKFGCFAEEETQISEKQEKAKKPIKILKKEDFELLCFENLKKIHDIGFLNGKFYVVFGDQPASLYLYSNEGEFLNNYPKSIRNGVAFNTKGAALVSWLNNGVYFMIATTNYFKSDNKIAIYDYHGRLIDTKEYKSLISACVYGNEEDEVEIEPVTENTVKVQESAYVPPHLRGNGPIRTLKKAPSTKPKSKPKDQLRTYDIVFRELEKCLEIKEKMLRNEDVSLEEENMIFKIKSLEEELLKFKKE